MGQVRVIHITDPGCPWAYSAEPAINALRFRYGTQLDWRTVMIGLTESGAEYEARGYTPELMAATPLRFKRYGMPFTTGLPRARVPGTGRACRAAVAARLLDPELGEIALRALRFAWFNTDLLLDEDADISEALSRAPQLDAAAIMARIDSPEVEAAYQEDRALARGAEGTPAQMQGKTARTDGPERYTAPSLIFEAAGQTLIAGGWQPLSAYDVLIANLDPSLSRRPPALDPLDALSEFPYALTTREIATLMAERDDEPNDTAAGEELVRLAARRQVERVPLGDDGLWRLAAAPASAAA
ncbi:MAG: DsbA family protein [Thermoleophilaceae bacterium]